MILPAGGERLATPAALIRRATEIVEIPAGRSLIIETSPSGEEILNVAVPWGKQWSVGIAVTVTETDA